MQDSGELKWRDFITLSDEWGAEEKADIITVLNQLEGMHIMQETLRGIPQNKIFDWQNDKVTIAPLENESFYDPLSRHILLPDDLKISSRYLDENNNEHKISLTRILLHELQHALDPDLHTGCLEALELAQKDGVKHQDAFSFLHHLILEKEAYSNEIPEKTARKIEEVLFSRLWNENIIIGRVNPVMKEFFDEVPRARFYMPIHQEEYGKYRAKPATPSHAYHVDKTRDVSEPVSEFLSDIGEDIAQMGSSFRKKVDERRSAAQHNFPGGHLRQF